MNVCTGHKTGKVESKPGSGTVTLKNGQNKPEQGENDFENFRSKGRKERKEISK